MTKENPYKYGVQQGEEVKFEITPLNGAVGQRVTASMDGDSLLSIGDDENPVFTFKVSKNTREIHIAKFAFSFVAGDPNNAKYKIKIKGSEGGEYICNSVLISAGFDQKSEYVFEVS